jgi:hypothetical protein
MISARLSSTSGWVVMSSRGDGTAPSDGDVTLARPPDSTHVNGAYQVSGSHAYRARGTYTAHLQVTARNGVTEAALTIRVHCCR